MGTGGRVVKKTPCPATGKRRYSTLEWAAKAALHASRVRGGAYRPYECPDCDEWHLTKNPGNPRVATVPGPFTPADMARLVGRRQETSA
jgi:hypothetical protein